MSMTDPIADMLTRIRNAVNVRQQDRGHAVLQGQEAPSWKC